MEKKGNIIFRTRPFLATILATTLFIACTLHYFRRQGINLELLIGFSSFSAFFLLLKEANIFFESIAREPRKYFLIICIVTFLIGGLITDVANILEIGITFTLFFIVYLIFVDNDSDLINFLIDLVIYSGVIAAIGVMIGLLESIFLSSTHFHHIANDYAYTNTYSSKMILSGFGYNHNFSSHIIIVAQSFLYLSTSARLNNLRKYLTILFLLALLIAATKISILFFSLLVFNYFLNTRTIKYLINTILISLYLFAAHILVAIKGTYELGSSHYRELLFSVGNLDFILGNYGYMKIAYFSALKENFFFSVPLAEISQTIATDPHAFIFSLIILGGFPLAFSVIAFLALGISKKLAFFEKKYFNYYYCGLISIVTESFLWDANNSIFFWIITLFAIMISKNSLKNFENRV